VRLFLLYTSPHFTLIHFTPWTHPLI